MQRELRQVFFVSVTVSVVVSLGASRPKLRESVELHIDLTLLHSCTFVSCVTELLCALDHSSNACALAQARDKTEFHLTLSVLFSFCLFLFLSLSLILSFCRFLVLSFSLSAFLSFFLSSITFFLSLYITIARPGSNTMPVSTMSFSLLELTRSPEEEDELLLEDGDEEEPLDTATSAGTPFGFSGFALALALLACFRWLSVLELEARLVSLTMATQAWPSWCAGSRSRSLRALFCYRFFLHTGSNSGSHHVYNGSSSSSMVVGSRAWKQCARRERTFVGLDDQMVLLPRVPVC